MPAKRVRQPIRLAAALLIATGALGACGSSHPKSGPDPASLVPAAAPVYAGATVRPTGSLQDAARSAGRSLTGQPDPYLRLLAALQTPGSPPLDYKRDVEPWLGTQAGVFLDAQGPALAAEGARLLGMLRQALSGSSAGTAAAPSAAGMRTEPATAASPLGSRATARRSASSATLR
jgi:hypothetical protein